MIIVPILKSWRYSFVNSCHSQMSVKSRKGKRAKVEGVPGKVSDYYFLMQPSLFPIDSLIDCYFIQNGKGKRLARRGTKKWASLSAVIFCIFIMMSSAIELLFGHSRSKRQTPLVPCMVYWRLVIMQQRFIPYFWVGSYDMWAFCFSGLFLTVVVFQMRFVY